MRLNLAIHFRLLKLAQILPLEAPPHECIPQPSYEGIAGGECEPAKGNRGDQWLAVALEGVDQNTAARQG